MPESHVFSTLTKSGTRDFIATESIPESVDDKKAYFIENIYMKKKYRPISVREGARIQGFDDSYDFNVPYSTAMGLLGNSIAVPIVKEVSPQVFCAVRMSGMGVALAPVIGEQVVKLMR
jgi:DNA (cytosine-5)-methyltransferase 1